MARTQTLAFALTMSAFLGLSACANNGTDGQVGATGLPGPAGPVGPMGAPGTGGSGSYDELDLPGTAYYPESLNSAVDGTIYVGSLASSTIVKFAPGSNTAVTFVSKTSAGKNVNGILVDETDQTVLACVNDFSALGTFKPVVIRFARTDGSEKATYQFPAPGACNDMAFDGKHNLYITDSLGAIYKLASGAQALTPWIADNTLKPSNPMGFGADGIAWDGQSNLFVNNLYDNLLLRVPINGDGSAGTPVKLTVTPALSGPDGMRALDATTLLVIEGVGRLTRLSLSGDTAAGTTLSNRLDSPTAVTKIGNDFWVSEGQVPHFLGQASGPPNIPFLIRRVPNF